MQFIGTTGVTEVKMLYAIAGEVISVFSLAIVSRVRIMACEKHESWPMGREGNNRAISRGLAERHNSLQRKEAQVPLLSISQRRML